MVGGALNMAGRTTILLAGCALLLTGTGATAQVDPPNVNQAIQGVDELLDGLEARRPVAADDKDLAKVEAGISQIASVDPNNAYLLYQNGRYLALLGRTGDATVELLDFVDTPQGKTDWRAFRLLGDLLLDEFPHLAKANYKKADALNPGEAGVLFGLSVCAMKLGRTKRGVSLAREAVKADGRSSIRFVSHLAVSLQAAKHSDEALKEAENALGMAERQVEQDPIARDSYENLQAQLGVLMAVLQTRIRAQTGNTEDNFLRFDTCLRQHNRVKERITFHDWLTAIEFDIESSEPDPLPAMLQLQGRLLGQLGRTDDAIAVWERVLKLDPGNARADAAIKRLR